MNPIVLSCLLLMFTAFILYNLYDSHMASTERQREFERDMAEIRARLDEIGRRQASRLPVETRVIKIAHMLRYSPVSYTIEVFCK